MKCENIDSWGHLSSGTRSCQGGDSAGTPRHMLKWITNTNINLVHFSIQPKNLYVSLPMCHMGSDTWGHLKQKTYICVTPHVSHGDTWSSGTRSCQGGDSAGTPRHILPWNYKSKHQFGTFLITTKKRKMYFFSYLVPKQAFNWPKCNYSTILFLLHHTRNLVTKSSDPLVNDS